METSIPIPAVVGGAPAAAPLDRVGSQWLAVSGFIPRRFVVNYRAPAALLARCLPAPLSIDERGGFGFVSVCALLIQRMGVDVAPSFLRFDNTEFLYRVGVRRPAGGAGSELLPSFLTLRSDVSSAALAALGRWFSHYRPRRADLTYVEEGGRVAMRCSSRDGLGDGDFKADLSSLSSTSTTSVFATADDASDFLLGMDHSVADLPGGRAQVQPIDHSPWEARFVEGVSAHFKLFDHLAEAWGLRFEYDSTLHMENITQVWRATRRL